MGYRVRDLIEVLCAGLCAIFGRIGPLVCRRLMHLDLCAGPSAIFGRTWPPVCRPVTHLVRWPLCHLLARKCVCKKKHEICENSRNVQRLLLLLIEELEALPVDNGWAALVVLLLGDPHLLEGGKGRQDGASDPDGVFPLRGSDDLDLNGGWGKSGDLLLHTISNTRGHGGAAGHDGVSVQVLPDVNIALHDGVVGGLVDSAGFHSQEGRLEEGLGGTETLVTDGDDLTVGKLIGLLEGGGGSSGGHFLLEVKGNIAKFLLDVTDNLALSGGGERVTTLGEDLHEVPM